MVEGGDGLHKVVLYILLRGHEKKSHKMSFRTPVIWCYDLNLQSPEYEYLIPNHNVDISSFNKLSKLFDMQPNQTGFLKSGQLTAMQELLTSH